MGLPERFTEQRPGIGAAGPGATLLDLVWPLLGRPIAFHRRLVDLTGDVKAALLLSQTVYWTRHGRDLSAREGWFHKTAGQWARETGLTVKEQAGARERLRALGLLEDRRVGLPARLHFRVRLDEIGRRLAARVDQRLPRSLHADDPERIVLTELLGPARAFHRGLVDIAGGVHGGLLLSRALHLTRARLRTDQEGWIPGSVPHWHHELGLSRREQEAARRTLAAAGLWEERVSGTPPRLRVRVRLEGLPARLAAGGTATTLTDGVEPDCGIAADSLSPKRKTGLRESHSLVSTKPPSLFPQNRRDCFAETAASNNEVITGGGLQPPQHSGTGVSLAPEQWAGGGGRGGSGGRGDSGGRGGSGSGPLIFPDRLLPAERAAAARLLNEAGAPSADAQTLLDELAGRLRTERVHSPVAYLRALLRRAAAGQFVPELAPRVAAERERRRREAEARQQREAEARRLSAERASPEHQARERERRARVSALLGEVYRRLSRPP
jgi:hypothetical protein